MIAQGSNRAVMEASSLRQQRTLAVRRERDIREPWRLSTNWDWAKVHVRPSADVHFGADTRRNWSAEADWPIAPLLRVILFRAHAVV